MVERFLNTSLAPERSPRLDLGLSLPSGPSTSTTFMLKSIEGASDTLVPIPKPSTTSESSETSLSSIPPDTKILTFLPPLMFSSHLTSSIIFLHSPLRLDGVSSLTP
jgi:hypothetical protein